MRLTEDEREEKAEMDYREDAQRELDDEAEAKRNASGTSPEVLSLMDAGTEGQKAGFMGLSPALNPFLDGTPEHHEWERRRAAAALAKLNGFQRAA